MNEPAPSSGNWFWAVISFLAALAFALALPPSVLLFRQSSCSCSNACINNLRQMDGAVQQWALETGKKDGDRVSMKDLMPYLKNLVACPENGTYTVGPTVTNVPKCSIAGHRLPQ